MVMISYDKVDILHACYTCISYLAKRSIIFLFYPFINNIRIVKPCATNYPNLEY